jgi:hypothetical protein
MPSSAFDQDTFKLASTKDDDQNQASILGSMGIRFIMLASTATA